MKNDSFLPDFCGHSGAFLRENARKKETDGLRHLPKLSVPARSSAENILTSIFVRLISFLTTPLFSRMLSPEDFGVFSLFQSLLAVLTVVVTLDLGAGVLFRGLQRFSDRRGAFLSVTLLFATVCSALLFLLCLPWILRRVSVPTSLLLYMQILGNLTVTVFSAGYRYTYKNLLPNLFSVLVAFLSPLLTVLLLKTTALGGTARVLGSVLATTAVALPAFLLVFLRGRTLSDREMGRFLLRFQLPLFPHYLGLSLLAQGDKLILERVSGSGVLASYSVAYSTALSLTFLSGGINLSLHPWILRCMARGDHEKMRSTLETLLLLFGFADLLFLCIAPEIFDFLVPSSYRGALFILYPESFSVLFLFYSSFCVAAELYLEKNRKIGLLTLSVSLLSLLSSALLIPRYGSLAAGWITLFSYGLLALSHGVLLRIRSGVSLLPRMRVLFLLSCVALGSSLLSLLTENLPLRILIFLCLLPLGLFLLAPLRRAVLEKTAAGDVTVQSGG